MSLYVDAKKYDKYPVFSYEEMFEMLDMFETMIEMVAGAKDPQNMFDQCKISVGDILDIHNILQIELGDAADKKMKHIFEIENSELFKRPGKKSKNWRIKYANNPFLWDIRTSIGKEDILEAFESAKKFRQLSVREKKDVRDGNNAILS